MFHSNKLHESPHYYLTSCLLFFTTTAANDSCGLQVSDTSKPHVTVRRAFLQIHVCFPFTITEEQTQSDLSNLLSWEEYVKNYHDLDPALSSKHLDDLSASNTFPASSPLRVNGTTWAEPTRFGTVTKCFTVPRAHSWLKDYSWQAHPCH